MENGCFLCGQVAIVRESEKFVARLVDCKACGDYQIDRAIAKSSEFQAFETEFYRVSAITRANSDRQSDRFVIPLNMSELLAGMPSPPATDKLRRALRYMGEHQTRLDTAIDVQVDEDFPLVLARDGDEFAELLDMLCQQGLLDSQNVTFGRSIAYRLTPTGWAQVEAGVRDLPKSNRAFVAMWFSDTLKPAWENGFKPALESTGFDPVRVDLIEQNGKVDDLIIAELRGAGLVIADFTGHRGGVYFEAGFALGAGTPLIWTCHQKDIGKAHFDTRQFSHIVWTKPEDLRSRLEARIRATVPRL